MENYREESNNRTLAQIDSILVDLPPFVRRFANEYLVTKNKSPRTVLGYVTDLRIFFRYISEGKDIQIKDISYEHLGSLNADDMQDYLMYLMKYEKDDENGIPAVITNKAPSRARKLSSIRALYKYLVVHNHLGKNIAALVDMPKQVEKPVIYLEKGEVRDVLHGAETGDSLTKSQNRFAKKQRCRDIAILTLLLNTGLRVSEMVGIDLPDIDWKMRKIRIYRKGSKEQYVYFNEAVEDALRDYLEYERKTVSADNDALFISRKNQRITVRSVERLVKKYTAAVVPSKHITPHKLRSTFATALYGAESDVGGDIYVVADALGHSGLETVKKYTNISDERRRKAASSINY